MRVARSTPPERVGDPDGVSWRGPLAILAALYLAAQVFSTMTTGSASPADALYLLFIVSFFLGPLGIIGAFAAVILIALAFRAMRFVGWKSCVCVGGALGMLLYYVMMIQASRVWRSFRIDFSSPGFIGALAIAGLAGMAGALVFWIILRPDRMQSRRAGGTVDGGSAQR